MHFYSKRFSKSFWNFFFSYALILCIPTFILTFFCYSTFINNFQTMTYETQLMHQENDSEEMDATLEELKNISLQFSSHTFPVDTLNTDVLARMDLMRQLQSLLALNTNLEEVIFWIPEQELFYSTQSSYSQTSYGQIHDNALITTLNAEWSKRKNAPSLPCNLFVGSNSSDLLYFSTPYLYASTMPRAYLVFLIETKRFIPPIDSPTTLIYRGNTLIDEINQPAFNASQQLPINKQNNEITYITTESPNNAITLTTALNTHELFSSFTSMRDIFTFINVIVFLICLFIVSLFSQKNAKPINELSHMLLKLGVISEEAMLRTTETTQTIAYMEALAQENQRLDKRLLEEQYTSRNLWLTKLLNGHEQYLPDLLPHLEKYGITLSSTHYTVGVIFTDTGVQSNRYFDTLLFQEPPFEQHYCIDAQNKIYLLIGSHSPYTGAIQALADSIVQKLANIDIRSEIFLGETYEAINNIHRAYTSALSTVSLDITYNGKVHYCQKSTSSYAFFYPKVELDSLQKALKTKDAMQFHTITESIAFQIEHTICRDFWYKTVCYEIANIIIRSFVNEENREWVIKHINRFLHDLSRTATPQEIIAHLRTFSNVIYSYINEHNLGQGKPSTGAGTVDDIIAFIHENYTDPAFFLGRIAQEFGMTQNNLSQQLKRALGIAPAKYINALRIDQAKVLLIQSALSVREISQQVGFTDSSTFNRNFRIHTNMTPNQYRTLNS